MNNLVRLACVVTLGLLMALEAGAADPADGDGARTLLARLKAKDDAFDNVLLRYTTWGEQTFKPFPYWKYPPRTPEELEDAKNNGPRVIRFRFHNELVVRGRDTTVTGELDRDVKPGPESRGWTLVPYHKQRQRADVVGMISDSKTGSGNDRFLEIREKGGPVGILDEKRMAIAFAHGFGFGTRIKSIESVVREGDRRILRGAIQIWWEDVSTFRIELGDDLLVKRAEIDCDVKGHRTRFEVATEGAIERHGFVFARTGHFKRMTLVPQAGKFTPEPRVAEEFSSRFDDAKFALKDDEYDTLTRLETTPGTEVRDYVTNQKYRLERDNTIKDLGPAVSGVR